MKTLYITKDMTMKERAIETNRVISELEDDEPFRAIEEMTLEKLKDQMQGAIDAFQAHEPLKTKVVSVTFDKERDVMVTETLITPNPDFDVED